MSAPTLTTAEIEKRLHEQAVASARRILGTDRAADAVAIADLVVGHYRNICAASDGVLHVADVPLKDFAGEMITRVSALVTASVVSISMIALEALQVAVRGSRQTRQ
jgi:hypothetical protein